MAVTGLGDWPISSQWFSDANGLVFCTRTSFVNKSSNDPLDDMMVDYFFSAAAVTVSARNRAGLHHIEHGFIRAGGCGFQPSEDGAIA